MIGKSIDCLKSYLKAPVFSPKGFLTRAVLLSVVLFLFHLGGGKEYTSILTGTSPTGETADSAAITIGLSYFFFHALFVFFVPVLVIASIIMHFTSTFFIRKSNCPEQIAK